MPCDEIVSSLTTTSSNDECDADDVDNGKDNQSHSYRFFSPEVNKLEARQTDLLFEMKS